MTTNAGFLQGLREFFTISLTIAVAALASAVPSQPARGAEGQSAQQTAREVIPGADRMTGAEREGYRRRMQAASTPEEKARIRADYAKGAGAAPSPAMVGNAERGATLHGACFSCHGIERYTRPLTYAMATFSDSLLRASGLSDMPPAEPARFKGKIQSLAALRDAVVRRNDFFNPKMTPQEVEDVVAYLNATYYKFPDRAE